MKDQINTIREALVLGIKAINHLGGAREAMPLHDAMPALAQLEAMVGEQKPVANCTNSDAWNCKYCRKATTCEALNDPRNFAAPVAQQPQAEPDWINGVPHWSPALIAKVKQMAAELDEPEQPQAEAVQACGHSMSLLLRSAESNEPLYCEACDDKSGRHDAERRETELLDANRRLQEKIGSADALKLHAIEELCQLGYTVKDGELFPPDHLHKLMEAANHPLCGKQTEAVPSSDLNPDEGDPVTLWAEIWRLREAVKGPDGYATWQDAATAERIRRVRAESKQAAPVAQQQYDQTALELCAVCGWKTLIPGDCCLNCERNKAQQPQAEAVQYTRADLDRAYSAGLAEGERLAIQQAEAVPPGYAGVMVWLGDRKVVRVTTKTRIQHEIEPGFVLRQDALQAIEAIAQQKGGEA